MKIVNIMVSTANGKITHDDDSDIKKWTSEEDGKHYRSFLENSSLIVMGSTTYEAAKRSMKHQDGKKRVVLTRQPEKYAMDLIPGKLEFSSETPNELVGRLEKEGYTEMLLVGGAHINKIFYEASLVTDLYLTIEPKLFGKGKTLIIEGDYSTQMQLESVKQLNEQGTLLLHYCVQ